MQLSDLRTHPLIKAMMYVAFTLIIISFVFFYGWNPGQGGSGPGGNQTVARFRSTGILSFLPWRKWEGVSAGEVNYAQSDLARPTPVVQEPEAGTRAVPQRDAPKSEGEKGSGGE